MEETLIDIGEKLSPGGRGNPCDKQVIMPNFCELKMMCGLKIFRFVVFKKTYVADS